jgi:hypothetical protein
VQLTRTINDLDKTREIFTGTSNREIKRIKYTKNVDDANPQPETLSQTYNLQKSLIRNISHSWLFPFDSTFVTHYRSYVHQTPHSRGSSSSAAPINVTEIIFSTLLRIIMW